MTETAYAAQIIRLTDDHKFQLDENELKKILMNQNVKNLPVMVVSVTGPYRSGRSFLLNFFLRYWTASSTARLDGSWLGEENEALTGFPWRGGSRAMTKGVLMWSEPFVTILPSGEKVAVLLIDTQGQFDSTSTVRESSVIFTLSSLLSSIQIYNLNQNINEDDLLILQLLTEYGKLSKESTGHALQVLEFLVRDWLFPYDFDYGATGGDEYLQIRLRDEPNMNKEFRDIRTNIRSSFEKVSCFLMPHPGVKAISPSFNGSIKDLGTDFRTHIVQFVSSLFEPNNLKPKLVLGRRVNASDLFDYFKAYLSLFNSNAIPTPHNIMLTMVVAGKKTVIRAEMEQYKNNMNLEWGVNKPSWVPDVDFHILHDRYKTLALSSFISQNKNSSDGYNMLVQEIDTSGKEFRSINAEKQLKAVESAKVAYDAEISKASGEDHLLSLQPIPDMNSKALGAAFLVYIADRKRFSAQIDHEILNLIRILESKYTNGDNFNAGKNN